MNIYYIGGSPCSGKSTMAEILAKKYDLYYFKVDDFIDKYMQLGAVKGYEICKKMSEMSWDEIWMRDPVLQCTEEVQWYEEIFEFVCEDLSKISCKTEIITEGAAYMPQLMKGISVSYDKYLSLTPEREFQLFHYSKREFVPYILRECTDKEKAFSNWMERDILFAKDIQKQCEITGYKSIINRGEQAVEEMVDEIERHFGFFCN